MPCADIAVCARNPRLRRTHDSARAAHVQVTHRLGRRPEEGGTARVTQPASVRPPRLVPTGPCLEAQKEEGQRHAVLVCVTP
jgi:hypothetical protein